MNSFPALCEYNVSPRSGSTIRIPQCAFENFGSATIESTAWRSCAGVTGPVIAVAVLDGAALPGAVARLDGAHAATATATAAIFPRRHVPNRAVIVRRSSPRVHAAD